MKLFHISDVLSVTTGRLLSTRHMEGMYDVLNFLTGDNLFTHQIPRAMRECQPWLEAQFPQLYGAEMQTLLLALDASIQKLWSSEDPGPTCAAWVGSVRETFQLPEILTVYEMGADMHTHIDPVEEARAMVGDDKVLTVGAPEAE